MTINDGNLLQMGLATLGFVVTAAYAIIRYFMGRTFKRLDDIESAIIGFADRDEVDSHVQTIEKMIRTHYEQSETKRDAAREDYNNKIAKLFDKVDSLAVQLAQTNGALRGKGLIP